MKNRYKISFWITILILITTNLYWIYNTVDNAVGHNYYEVSCEEWQKDNSELIKLLPMDYDYPRMLELIKNKGLEFEEFEKGENKVIQFHSFDLIYGNNGKLTDINQR